MKASSKGLLTQISQFWNMLDDLAENDPERYKNFIEQELKDGKELCVDPEPHLCLQTKILVCRAGARDDRCPIKLSSVTREYLTLLKCYFNTRKVY